MGTDQNINDERELMERFLLGELPDDERKEVEERFFRDDDFFEGLLLAEQDLVDAYNEGNLAGPRRERFEKYYLASPRGRDNVRLFQTLPKAAIRSGVPSPRVLAVDRPPFWEGLRLFFRQSTLRPAWAVAAGLVVVILGAVVVIADLRLRTQLEKTQSDLAQTKAKTDKIQQLADRQRGEINRLDGELRGSRDRLSELEAKGELQLPASGTLVSLALEPGRLRSEEKPPKLVIPHQARFVRIQLYVASPEPSRWYRAVLLDLTGQELLRVDRLKETPASGGRVVELVVPSSVFSGGENYILKLSGRQTSGKFEELDSYFLDVVKK